MNGMHQRGGGVVIIKNKRVLGQKYTYYVEDYTLQGSNSGQAANNIPLIAEILAKEEDNFIRFVDVLCKC